MFNVDLPAAVLGFVGVHLGLRAEVATIERAAADGDLLLAHRRADLLAQVLGHHHRAEDTVLFPALEARNPGFEATTAEMEAQHEQLDVELAALTTDLGRAEQARRLVERHLVAEEQRVLPVWLASFDAAEHERFATRLQRSTPLRHAGLMVSWLLDTAPADAFEVAWAQVPESLRLVHRVWWRRRYERAFGTMAASDRPMPPSGVLGRLAAA